MNGLISYMGAYMLSHFSHVQLFATLWIIACQASLPMGFSRQEYWSRLPCHPPGDLPAQGSNPRILCLLHWQVGSLALVPAGKPNQMLGKIQRNTTEIKSSIISSLYNTTPTENCIGCSQDIALFYTCLSISFYFSTFVRDDIISFLNCFQCSMIQYSKQPL